MLIVDGLVGVKKVVDEGVMGKGKSYKILWEGVIEVGGCWEG